MKRLLAIGIAAALLLAVGGCSGGSGGQDQASWSPRREKAEEVSDLEQVEYTELDTACGPIRGVVENGCLVFKGIRYATAERWERAQMVTGWEGQYDATEFGPRSCQFRGFYGVEDSAINQFYYDEAVVHPTVDYSEDCLNLNIWTWEGAEQSPVLVFIHGGAFMTGGNSEPFIDGEAYVKNGVILVSINYRLGPFATAYGDGFEGNLSLTDQVEALKWIRANIADYGGDPDRITIMGESAGAISVQNLLVTPLTEGMIAGAIMMSGGGDLSSLASPTSPSQVQPIWDKLKENLQVESLTELQQLPAASLYANWQKVLGELPQYASTAANPVVDGSVLPQRVSEAQASGQIADVPCIIGVLSEDMWPHTLYTAALDFALGQYQAGREPTYLYYFDRQLPGENRFGAFHAADLWYAFGTLYRNWRPFEDTDYEISQRMVAYISNFARTGNPNSGNLPTWSAVTQENQQAMRFGSGEMGMYTPDLEQLQNTQATASVFPYK